MKPFLSTDILPLFAPVQSRPNVTYVLTVTHQRNIQSLTIPPLNLEI